METSGIVSQLDVPSNIVDGVATGRVLRAMNPLILECTEERFGHRIIIAYTGPPNGLTNVQFA